MLNNKLTSEEEALKEEVTEDRVQGLPARGSLDLDMYRGSNIPTNWEISGVLGDILMVEYADVTEGPGGDEYIERDGILVSTALSQKVWRIGKIIKAGPLASPQAKPGEYIMFPSDKGIPLSKFGDKDYVFLNEERIFAFVEPVVEESNESNESNEPNEV